MGVDVDEARRDHLAARVDDTASRAGGAGLDGDNPPLAHAHIGLARRRPGAVDHLAAADEQIVHHFVFSFTSSYGPENGKPVMRPSPDSCTLGPNPPMAASCKI